MKIVSTLLVAMIFAGHASAQTASIVLPPEEAAHAAAHVILVRHATKACGSDQCPLSNPVGIDQAEKLGALLAQNNILKLDLYSSAACRTIETARLAATRAGVESSIPVRTFLSGSNSKTCERSDELGASVLGAASHERMRLMKRLQTDGATMNQSPHYSLVADHSNFICLWFKEFHIDEDAYARECPGNKVSEGDYGDIYWLYAAPSAEGVEWRLKIIEDAFL